MIWLVAVIGGAAGIISGCREKQSSESSDQAFTGKDYPYPIFSLVSPENSGIHFNNRIQETEKWNILKYDFYDLQGRIRFELDFAGIGLIKRRLGEAYLAYVE